MRYLSPIVWVLAASANLANAQTADMNDLLGAFDAAPKPPMPSSITLPSTNQQNLLVGVTVNGESQDSASLLQSGNDYYLTVNKVAELLGIAVSQFTLSNHTANIHTPLGQVTLSADDFLRYQDTNYIALSTLRKLGVSAVFNHADLAVHINMAWQPNALSPSGENKTNTLPIDAYPKKAGLLGLSVDLGYSTTFANPPTALVDRIQSDTKLEGINDKPLDLNQLNYSHQLYTNVGAFGFASGGVWGINASKGMTQSYQRASFNPLYRSEKLFEEPLSDLQVDNAYWQTAGKNFATRVGTNQSGLSNLGVEDFSGLSMAYSNQDIKRHVNRADNNTRSLLQSNYQNFQTITGTGTIGGIAELRINGMGVARVQIGLDGIYEFINLNANLFDYRTSLVEVAIFDYPLASVPSQIRRIHIANRRANVATDEWLVEANAGRLGNILNPDTHNRGWGESLYAEYGINNRLSLRGQVGDFDQAFWRIGANSALGRYSNLDLDYWHAQDATTFLSDWQYQREKWFANYQYSLYRHDLADDEVRTASHSLLLNYQPNTKTNVNASYYDYQLADGEHNRYQTAMITRQLTDHLSTAVNWDSRDDFYQYRLTGITNNHGQYSITGNRYQDEVSYQHRFDDNNMMGHSLRRWHPDVAEYGGKVDYQGFFTHNFSDNNQLTLGYGSTANQLGWQVQWQYFKNNAIRVSLGYQHNYLDDVSPMIAVQDSRLSQHNNYLLNLQKRDFAFLQVHLNFWQPPAGGITLGNYPSTDLGSIVVDVTHPSAPKIDSEQLSFSLNGKQTTATLINDSDTHSRYLINGLLPNVYTVSLDSKNLPFDYQTSQLVSQRVKVADYAPTLVNIPLTPAYGFAGKTSNGNGNIPLSIWRNNALVTTVISDDTGHFQVLDLPSGQYQITADGYMPLTVTIGNDYVMNLTLLAKSSEVKQGQ